MRPIPASGVHLCRNLTGLENKQHGFCMLHIQFTRTDMKTQQIDALQLLFFFNKIVYCVRFSITRWKVNISRSKQMSTVAIFGLQFGLHCVVVTLSFLRSNQPCIIVTFLFLTDQIFYRSYTNRQHFRLRFLASLCLFELNITFSRKKYNIKIAFEHLCHH